MKIGDFSAHILVNDQPSEEYCVEFETPTRAICWIASEEGKVTVLLLTEHIATNHLSLTRHWQTFGIEWHCHAETRTKGNAGWVNVDGIFCGGSPMFPGPLGNGDTGEMYCISTDTKTRDFMFLCIELSGAFILHHVFFW